jgi:hypothetical protein
MKLNSEHTSYDGGHDVMTLNCEQQDMLSGHDVMRQGLSF